MSDYSADLKKAAMALFEAGYSTHDIAQDLLVSHRVICDWYELWKAESFEPTTHKEVVDKEAEERRELDRWLLED